MRSYKHVLITSLQMIALALLLVSATTAQQSVQARPYMLTVTTDGDGSGSVTKTPDSPDGYASGQEVSLQAIAGPHSKFSYWVIDGYATFDHTNPYVITMDSNRVVVAIFQGPSWGNLAPSYMDWANSVDAKGKRAAVKRKPDNVVFKLQLTVPTVSNIITLDFGMVTEGAITSGITKTETLATFNGKKFKDTLTGLFPGDIFQIDGRGKSGKKMQMKYQWDGAKTVTLKADSFYLKNTVGLPMPNLHNVGEELFPKGFGQTSPFFANGMLIGVPVFAKGAHTVLMKKYADVVKSLVTVGKSGNFYHSSNLRCLDSIGKKVFDKQQSTYTPDKHSNLLFGELVTYKLNLVATITNKMNGLIDYNLIPDHGTPFTGISFIQLAAYADTMISCITPVNLPSVTLQELYDELHYWNTKYSSEAPGYLGYDTSSFGTKTYLGGLYDPVFQNQAGNMNPGHQSASSGNAPEAFGLSQNYPNPFNPSTVISYSLPVNGIVSLKVFNMLGQEIATLLDRQEMESGDYEVPFNATNLTSGVYFYRINVESVDENGVQQSFTDVKRMMLVK